MDAVEPNPVNNCDHHHFEVEAGIQRLTDDGKLVEYRAEIRLTCTTCREPFVFKAPVGLHAGAPTVSLDGLTLRVPIQPRTWGAPLSALGPKPPEA